MRFASLACFVAAVSAFELPASVSRRSILAAAPAVFAGVPAAFAEKDNAGYQRIGTMHKEGNQYLKSAVRGMRAVNMPKLAHANIMTNIHDEPHKPPSLGFSNSLQLLASARPRLRILPWWLLVGRLRSMRMALLRSLASVLVALPPRSPLRKSLR